MSGSHTCVVHEFPIPDREYRAGPPERWAAPPRRRTPPSRARRRPVLPQLILIGLALFWMGFLLGRAGAVGAGAAAGDAPQGKPVFTLLPEESGDSQGVKTVPGGVVGKTPEPDPEDWYLRLVNGEHPLPEDFQVPELTKLINGQAIDSRAYPDLQRMMDDCRAAGLQPTICSSYRTWEKQSELFERKVQSCLDQAGSREEAERQAALWVARPGTSEHQAGLAVDIVDKSYQLLDEGQEETEVQKWLMEHCAEYGFILRYPTEKSALTGVGYEPWHYRYVGEIAAGEIMAQGLCLEEYLLR